MSDDQTPDFKSRLRDHEAMRGNLKGIKPGGTSARRRSSGNGIALRIRGAILIVAVLVGLKSVIYFFMGASAYNTTLMPLNASSAFYERAIGFVMQPDPATLFVADFFTMTAAWAKSLVSGLGSVTAP